MNNSKSILMLVLSVVLCVCIVGCSDEIFDYKGDPPEIMIDKNTTATDAKDALTLVKKFMTWWEQGNHKKASSLVFAPGPKHKQTREDTLAYITSRTARLESIHLVTVRKGRARKQDIWNARVHFTLEPFDEMRLDLIKVKGKWWIERGYECVYLLERAVAASDANEVRRLIECGADINQRARRHSWEAHTQSKRRINGHTPLTQACSSGLHEMTDILVNLGAKVDEVSGNRTIPILCAVLMNDTNSIKTLLDAGCSTLLNGQHVMLHGHPYDRFTKETEQFLLLNGAGKTLPSHALFYSCQHNREATARWVLENGGDVNANYGSLGGTQLERRYSPIHAAVLADNIGIVDILLQHNADINDTGNIFSTPLMDAVHTSAFSKDTSMLEFLISKGAKPEFENTKGWNALHSAAFKSSLAAVKVLLEVAPGLVNSQTEDGKTPFWLAICGQRLNVEVVKYLAEHGTDMKLPRNDVQNILSEFAKGVESNKERNYTKREKEAEPVIDYLKSLN